MSDTDPTEPQIPDWPADWPGRDQVDLGYVGDPGMWLEIHLPDPADFLFDESEDCQAMAEELAEAYIGELADAGFPLPTDFEVTEEEMRQSFTAEFLSFLREWRKQAESARPTTTETWELLKQLGFVPDASVISDVMPGLSYDFGNFTLSASAVMGKWFEPLVLFTGVLATPRTLAEVSFELPRVVASKEQLTAFLVYYLDKAARGDVFHPSRPVAWISEGRATQSLLPWEMDMAAYRARPHCSVRRDWLRLALNSLAEIITKADDTAAVEFSFDGSVLMIRCSDQVVPMSAIGNAWPSPFEIPAGKMRRLPKRLMRDELEVSVHGGRLHIGRNCFDGAREKQL